MCTVQCTLTSCGTQRVGAEIYDYDVAPDVYYVCMYCFRKKEKEDSLFDAVEVSYTDMS